MKPPMLEPRIATRARLAAEWHIASASPKAVGPHPLRRAFMATGVVGDRGHARRGRGARSRSGSPSRSPRRGHHHPALRLARQGGTAHRKARRARPARDDPVSDIIIAQPMGDDAEQAVVGGRGAPPRRARPRLPAGTRLERAGRARDRRLRRRGARRASSACPVRLRRGRCAAARPRWPRSRTARSGSRCLRERGIPVHRRAADLRRGGPVVRRGLRRRAAPGPEGGVDPARIYMHGNNESDAELEQAVAPGRPRGRRLVRRDRAARADRRGPQAEGAGRVTPGSSPRPIAHPHRYRRTRSSDTDAAGGEPAVALRGCRPGLPRAACPHRLAGVRPRCVRVARRRAPGDRRVPGDQPRSRVCDRLHARGPPAASIRVRGGDAAPRPEDATVLVEPGRSLVGNAGVTLYRWAP